MTFTDPDDVALFEERAAIREYEGGLSRAVAESLAILEVLAHRRRHQSPQDKAA